MSEKALILMNQTAINTLVFKNSSTGTDSVDKDIDQNIISVVEGERRNSPKNWTTSLQHFPGFS